MVDAELVKLKWHLGKELPEGRADPSVAVYGGKIYVFGGYHPNGKHPKEDVFMFDIKKGVWTKCSSMPTPRWGMISVKLDDKIYVFGGHNKQELDILEIYDPKNNEWDVGPKMPFKGQGLMGTTINGRIYLVYGRYTYEFDPETVRYSRKANVITPRKWGVVAVVDDLIYLIGGVIMDSKIPTSIRMDLGKVITVATKHEGILLNTNSVEVYNPEKDRWKKVSKAPFRMFGMGRENPVIDGKIYCTHGQGTAGHFFSSCYIYDTYTDTWIKGPNAKHPRDGVACAVLDNSIYVTGGRNTDPPERGLSFNEILVVG